MSVADGKLAPKFHGPIKESWRGKTMRGEKNS